MKLDSVVIDTDTGERLPNATVRISNSDGSLITGGVYADADGNFSIEVPETGFIIASYTGYQTAVYPVSLVLQSSAAALEKSPAGVLEEVIVTAKKNSKGFILVAVLLAGSHLAKKL